MHYLFGATMGAIYGAYAEHRHPDASGAGFGMTVWLAADELAMPLLGLSGSTLQRPLEMHLQALVAHLVYGTVTEATRRALQPARPVNASRYEHAVDFRAGRAERIEAGGEEVELGLRSPVLGRSRNSRVLFVDVQRSRPHGHRSFLTG
jgi:hypothetical protein